MGIIISVTAGVSAISWFVIRHNIRKEERKTFKTWENNAGSFVKNKTESSRLM